MEIDLAGTALIKPRIISEYNKEIPRRRGGYKMVRVKLSAPGEFTAMRVILYFDSRTLDRTYVRSDRRDVSSRFATLADALTGPEEAAEIKRAKLAKLIENWKRPTGHAKQ